ncbi:glycolate oxidase subunit GlcF [Advenella mimigardefordensis]|uniref:Glycolate oxidase iron-sulfur subunit n=1 Tax=Advenella mimigardefordensis (strain DSM 17166 / LMG 22922 / DPN7) TaxID=1247726 RepID=W0PFW0_ADVMD|nr:glycolate oxidase subunit GlcF [Advenella mimigardefordensis]AHG64392.1 glycolate oxidase iron-sulfur subunit [Advenella mimigardefordensis DPN7]
MQTNLADWAKNSSYGEEVDAILRKCVHCGFCSATCPSYQILGDERDSPRGRIYLIKEIVEGKEPTSITQKHLDQCLTCHNCETTCPSGVQYGHLVDIGRELVAERVVRTPADRFRRTLLAAGLNSQVFAPAVKLGRMLRSFMPATLAAKLPEARPAGALPAGRHQRQVLVPLGCVQPALMPSIDAATIRVLDAAGISSVDVSRNTCCGAVNFHLDKVKNSIAQMKSNIDAWVPLLESGQVEAVIMNASGCGAFVKEYPFYLRNEPDYLEKARYLVQHVKDIAEVIAPEAASLKARFKRPLPASAAFHPPCTLQHWQGLRPLTESLLRELGFDLKAFGEANLCCGSAGTYSVLQPEIATGLRDRKLESIGKTSPSVIITSNMGCMSHLQTGTQTPVRHWVEVVDAALSA